jgi:protoheme IX farnesyltransferase
LSVWQTIRENVPARLRAYWMLTKPLQTGLLLATGLAGFMSARCPVMNIWLLLALAGTLFLAISGSTVLNMVVDRDIDCMMTRTTQRPLPSGQASQREALLVGLGLAILGVGGAFVLALLYGAVVLAGLFFDVVVYSLWLKRRTAWSILWGGISGGMPILAGRVLATGQFDVLGGLLALAVLLWIPTHIVTFSIKYADDYERASVPVFPTAYGERVARLIISLSTGAAVVVMLAAMWQIGLHVRYLHAAVGMGAMLLGLAAASTVWPSPRLDFGLFKAASLYMLGAMGLIIIAGV